MDKLSNRKALFVVLVLLILFIALLIYLNSTILPTASKNQLISPNKSTILHTSDGHEFAFEMSWNETNKFIISGIVVESKLTAGDKKILIKVPNKDGSEGKIVTVFADKTNPDIMALIIKGAEFPEIQEWRTTNLGDIHAYAHPGTHIILNVNLDEKKAVDIINGKNNSEVGPITHAIIGIF